MIGRVLSVIGMVIGIFILILGYVENEVANMVWGGFLTVVNQVNILLLEGRDK